MKNLNNLRINFYLGFVCAVVACGSGTVSADEWKVAWDEAVNGDMSNSFDSPSIITISEPGGYIVRASTGPVVPRRLEKPRPANARGPVAGLWTLADKNGDGRLQRAETSIMPNQRIHFDTYDINGDDELEQSEVAQFTLSGDSHDVFNFKQEPGINLVAIKAMKYDSGGPENDATVLVVIDTDESGERYEAAGIDFVDDEKLIDTLFTQDMVMAVVKPDPENGTEVYEEYGLWRHYRRNDETVMFRIGEMQAKALTEFVFVFE